MVDASLCQNRCVSAQLLLLIARRIRYYSTHIGDTHTTIVPNVFNNALCV